MFTKITVFDRVKPSLTAKMPTILRTELYNGLVTVSEMKPRKFSSPCQAGDIAPFFFQAEPVLHAGCLTSVEDLF